MIEASYEDSMNMEPIKVALAGIGNCASSFVQGLAYYKQHTGSEATGLLHDVLAGMRVKNIAIVAAFDVDDRKVGKDLADAIFSAPNVARRVIDLGKTGVTVMRGETKDGILDLARDMVLESKAPAVDVAAELNRSGATMLVCLTPSGAQQVAEYYATAALSAGVAFINATPCTIASDPAWGNRFKEANVPLVGDDLMDQVGTTILHRLILQTLVSRGVRVKESYALDVGGGVDSFTTIMREEARLIKRAIKSKAVAGELGQDTQVVAGTTDYVEHLENGRHTKVWIAGEYFNGAPLQIDMMINTFDGDNGGSVLCDVIRATHVALVKESGGPLPSISVYGFKNPPGGSKNPEHAEKQLSEFILGTLKA